MGEIKSRTEARSTVPSRENQGVGLGVDREDARGVRIPGVITMNLSRRCTVTASRKNTPITRQNSADPEPGASTSPRDLFGDIEEQLIFTGPVHW